MDVIRGLLKSKYKMSNKRYKKRFKDEKPEIFLFWFDMMNVYPLFPTPLTFNLMSKNINLLNTFNIKDITDSNIEKYIKPTKELQKELNIKINEFVTLSPQEIKKRARPMIRKFFSYEIIDNITEIYGGEYVTTAWLKCFEIVSNYDMLNNTGNDKTVNYFGICEQPGAFIYALNHYTKTNLKKDFDFIIESLVDPTNKKIFKPEQKLFDKYKNNYDYGADGTGDVTKVTNLKYYRKKYIKEQKKHFHIITADCGLDCSADFKEQEKNLSWVFMGQLILALSIASLKTNYFFKLFTSYDNLTHEMLFLASQFFDEVKLVRTLTTKPQSGETYCICKGFNKDENYMDKIVPQLYEWYSKPRKFLFNPNIMPKDYYHTVYDANKVLTIRRAISVNFLLWRFYNSHYAKRNYMVHEHIKKLVKHYMKYYIDLFDVQKLDKDKRLIDGKKMSRQLSRVVNFSDVEKKKIVTEEISAIIRHLDIPFYNDKFISQIMGKNYFMKVSPIKLDIDIKKKKFNLYNTNDAINSHYFKIYRDVVYSEERSATILRKNLSPKINIYIKYQGYFFYHKIIKHLSQLYKKIPKSLTYVILTAYYNKEREQVDKKYFDQIVHKFGMKIDRELILDSVDYKKRIMNKLKNTDIFFIRRIRIYTDNDIDLVTKDILFMNRLIVNCNLNSTFICTLRINYKTELIFDLISIYTNYFQRVDIYYDKYHYNSQYVTMILFKKNKQMSKKLLFEGKDIYRVTNQNIAFYTPFVNKLYHQFLDRFKLLSSVSTLVHKKEKYYSTIIDKINIIKEYINNQYKKQN